MDDPAAKSVFGPKPPAPFPNSTETEAPLKFVTATSGWPSPLKSAIAIALGEAPVANDVGAPNVPSRQVRLARAGVATLRTVRVGDREVRVG